MKKFKRRMLKTDKRLIFSICRLSYTIATTESPVGKDSKTNRKRREGIGNVEERKHVIKE
jgi:hypothetical protein